MQATIANLKRIAEKAGATLERDGTNVWDVTTYQVVAPDGFNWNESDSYHLLVLWEGAHDPEGRREAFEDAIGRIAAGFHPMTDEERFLADEIICPECGKVGAGYEAPKEFEAQEGRFFCDEDCAEYFLRRTVPGGSDRASASGRWCGRS